MKTRILKTVNFTSSQNIKKVEKLLCFSTLS